MPYSFITPGRAKRKEKLTSIVANNEVDIGAERKRAEVCVAHEVIEGNAHDDPHIAQLVSLGRPLRTSATLGVTLKLVSGSRGRCRLPVA